MKPKSKHELWMLVTEGAKKQGYKRAVSSTGSCQYREVTTEGTLKCNVGHLIPDDMYDETIEGATAVEVCTTTLRWNIADPLGRDLITMAGDLQHIHDDSPSAEAHRLALIEYGIKNNLPTEHI